MAFGCLTVLGATYPGKNIVMYNYVLEITPKENSQAIINLVSLLETSWILDKKSQGTRNSRNYYYSSFINFC